MQEVRSFLELHSADKRCKREVQPKSHTNDRSKKVHRDNQAVKVEDGEDRQDSSRCEREIQVTDMWRESSSRKERGRG